MIKNNTNNEQTKDKPFNYLEVLMRQAAIEQESHDDVVELISKSKITNRNYTDTEMVTLE